MGGTTKKPTYKNIGDYTEGLQIDYNPKTISYQSLLDTFWANHFPCRRAFSKQYMKAIYYHNATQKKLAERSLQKVQRTEKRRITTKILPVTDFYRAEDYHQKYMLRLDDKLMKLIGNKNFSSEQFTDSTLTARLNGYAGGHGTKESLLKQLENLGLSPNFMSNLKPALEE